MGPFVNASKNEGRTANRGIAMLAENPNTIEVLRSSQLLKPSPKVVLLHRVPFPNAYSAVCVNFKKILLTIVVSNGMAWEGL